MNAYLFYGNGCPHCAKENAFLDSIKDKYSNLNIYRYEVYFNQDNSKKMQEVSSLLKAEATGVPFLIIGDKYFIGYSETYSGEEIEPRIKECSLNNCTDSVASILGVESTTKIENKIISTDEENTKEIDISSTDNILQNNIETENNNIPQENKEKVIKLPFLGKTDINNLSIPILAILMGLLDGFNPCAMWTLLFLISLLLGMENKKRMWALGIAFIISSASVYFIFMSAWLNLVLFLGIVLWVRLLIGGLAIFGGSYSIKSFFKNKDGGCEVTGNEKRQKVFEKLKNITKKNNLLIALGGIILLAFLVNLVELICSAGLPAVFTQVLAMNNLPTSSYYLYILLYILFFMIDDLFVFFIAMITLQMTGITTKYARYSHLIGGILMFIIGILLIFKPEWLMFG
ncbi:MAG: hypothetical protein EOM85_00650 [Candidatus Moranbacteria bacterium]|nr:hypothetical protein [Candidatus Moranbacteria bacterium]